MTMTRPTAPAPAITRAACLEELLLGQPPARAADPVALQAKVRRGHRLVVLDDDPTGTQSVVSLWDPISGPAQGIPYIVFAGNVGSDDALLDVVTTLRSA